MPVSAMQKSNPVSEMIAKLPSGADKRFKSKEWQKWPFNSYYQGFLLLTNWWRDAAYHIPGMEKHHAAIVSFIVNQWFDSLSPSNFPFTNPDILKTAQEQGCWNFYKGFLNLLEDAWHIVKDLPPAGTEKFQAGKTVAITDGKVIYRNHLIELIQYAPVTAKVYAEPVLIVPAWIMKYYILDLQPHNSLVKYLVNKGHTVFMISWRNPDAGDRDLGMNDYLEKGLNEALKAVKTITMQKVHVAGYCLGGTLLAILAAKLAQDNDNSLKTVTLLAAQTDFKDAGEIGVFIDESQVSSLENIMSILGYLDKFQMRAAFQLLRSNDLIWPRLVNDYWQGKRKEVSDIMAWSADATRMPYKMHSEYLRRFFLQNDLAEGRYTVKEEPTALKDITVPIFAVGTVRDHVAPWKSVYKIYLLTRSAITFVLTGGGHNAGIVSEPGHSGRSYQICTVSDTARYLSPEAWQDIAETRDGSWWTAWQQWLADHSSKEKIAPAVENMSESYRPIMDAPGTFVLMR